MGEEKSKNANEYGIGKPVDEKIVLEGMKSIENEQTSEAEQSQESVTKQQDISKKLLEALRQSGLDSKTYVSDVRASEDKERQAKAYSHSDIKVSKVSPFFYQGSIGATRVPPFDYQWSWEWARNSPDISKSSNRTTGEMRFNIWEDVNNSSTGLARTAIGIFFRPPTVNGHLLVSASPAFRASWGTWCAWASAHTDGWIGLFIGSYNASDNSYAGTIIDQKTELFSDDSWWSGVGRQNLSNSGFPLGNMIPVDNAHWYALWVWSGGRIDADGWGGTFSGSGANSNLVTNIPSMSWTYFG